MAYKPSVFSEIKSVEELSKFLEEELRHIEKGQSETIALDLRPTGQEPVRPREGMIAYADGTGWDPGNGEGLYLYKDAAWEPVQIGFPFFYNVKDFGALGDSTTDDTAAIQSALDTVPAGATLFFPEGLYIVLGSGSSALTRSLPINIVGAGYGGTGFSTHANFPNTRDVLTFDSSLSAYQGIRICDFGFYMQTRGRNGLVVDATSGNLIFMVHIHDCFFSEPDASQAIKFKGNIAYSTIERCNVAGILLEDTGDGVTIRENVIGGTNDCIRASFTAGAGGFCVIGNVIAGTAGHLIIEDGGHAPVIAFNEFETPVSVANTYGFLVDISSSSAVGGARLEGNGYSVLANTSNPVPIRIRSGSLNTQIKEAKILNQTGPHIQVDAGALDTAIDRTCWAVTSNLTVPLNVTDSGGRTGFISSVFSLEATASLTGTNTASAQPWFPGGVASAVTLRESSVYEFEGSLATIKTQGTTTRTVGIGFGGTAGIESIMYTFLSATADQTTFPIITTPLFSPVEQETNVTAVGESTSSSQAFAVQIKGKLKTSTVAGTFSPQFTYSAAPGGAPTIRKHSYFRVWEGK